MKACGLYSPYAVNLSLLYLSFVFSENMDLITCGVNACVLLPMKRTALRMYELKLQPAAFMLASVCVADDLLDR